MTEKSTIAGLISQAAKKLRDDFEHIRATISHSGEKGGETEDKVREFLNGHIPKRFHATKGFVIDVDNQMSNHQDVIIYDEQSSPVYKYDGANQIVTSLLGGSGLFGNQLLDYKAAGIIYLGVLNGTIDPNTGNWAVWNLFNNGITNNASVLSLDQQALLLAGNAPNSAFNGIVIYTPVGGSPRNGPQEFIGYNPPLVTPEPASLTLLGTGLIGLAGLVRKKFSSQS